MATQNLPTAEREAFDDQLEEEPAYSAGILDEARLAERKATIVASGGEVIE